MFKKLLLPALVTLSMTLSGCAYLKDRYEKPTCEESVAIASETVVAASNQILVASENKLISVEKRRLAVNSIDSTYLIVERAGSFCTLNEAVAQDYVEVVYDTVREILTLVEKEDK